jgi:DNA end-binding protein Ku
MPARPIWRGHLRLALVSCPVALSNAKHDRATIRFNMINPETGNRIGMKTVDAETDQEVGGAIWSRAMNFARTSTCC